VKVEVTGDDDWVVSQKGGAAEVVQHALLL